MAFRADRPEALERRKVGVSRGSAPSGANQSGLSSPKPAPQTAFLALNRSWTGVMRSGRAAGSSSFGNETRNRRP